MHRKETVVISVGGSLIAPNGLDLAFLRKLKTLIDSYMKKGFRFVIVTGGGSTARTYQSVAAKLDGLNEEDLNWLGIHATRLNGHLLRTIFRKHAYPTVIKNREELEKVPKNFKLLIGAGWQPGATTDYRAVQLARHFGSRTVVNLSNIDYVYDKDPKKYKDAKPYTELTWKEFKAMVPSKLTPGVHTPFDPRATKEAAAAGLEVVMLNGAKLGELAKYLSGKSYKGTRVR
jgi:uridylate kinase